jgi:hypothetical protein
VSTRWDVDLMDRKREERENLRELIVPVYFGRIGDLVLEVLDNFRAKSGRDGRQSTIIQGMSRYLTNILKIDDSRHTSQMSPFAVNAIPSSIFRISRIILPFSYPYAPLVLPRQKGSVHPWNKGVQTHKLPVSLKVTHVPKTHSPLVILLPLHGLVPLQDRRALVVTSNR